jgi:putative ATP-dependent endonuclease of OLD family
MPEEQPANELTNSGIRVGSVRVANFRSLRNIEVELGDIVVLVGMNNSGKTSFLRALHLALSGDRRHVSPDDFHVGESGQPEGDILIDVQIVPTDRRGVRDRKFADIWIDADFGGALISTDSADNEFIAVRTRIHFDSVKSEFDLKRNRLETWPPFREWTEATAGGRAPRFSQLPSFFVDAQRDVVADLRNRSSYFGRLLSKIEIPEEDVAELEEKLRALNEEIVGKSDVLSHVRGVLAALNQTVPAFGEGIEITPVSKKLRDLTKGVGLQFSDSGGSSFPVESHGMGTRSWASLLSFEAYVSWTARLSAASHLPFHPVLSLEEPEAHLHPNAQRAVYGQLARSHGQRIISTHSPYIAGQADLAELVHFSKEGRETRVRRMPSGLAPDDRRKVRREVMRSRGELLFARAVVLFEGETEEQALPLFARYKWGRYPFERGVAFVGVGGEGNYLPFLRVFDELKIPWFIFSDGEPNARRKVERALRNFSVTLPDSRVIILPNDRAIEAYLMDEGYERDLRNAVVALYGPYNDDRAEKAMADRVQGWSEEGLREFLSNKRNKVGMAPLWASAVIKVGGTRAIPPAIGQLLDAVDVCLNGDSNEGRKAP